MVYLYINRAQSSKTPQYLVLLLSNTMVLFCILGCFRGKYHISTDDKINWWIRYRGIVRKHFSSMRAHSIRQFQRRFVKGKVLLTMELERNTKIHPGKSTVY